MSKLILLIPLFLVSYSAGAISTDTISYWHIDYNQTTILKSHQGMEAYVLEMDSDTIHGDDLFTLKYSNGCMVCMGCKTHLAVYDQNENLVQREDSRGDWTPITISFQFIIEHHMRTGETSYDFYFLQEGWDIPDQALHVLRLEFK